MSNFKTMKNFKTILIIAFLFFAVNTLSAQSAMQAVKNKIEQSIKSNADRLVLPCNPYMLTRKLSYYGNIEVDDVSESGKILKVKGRFKANKYKDLNEIHSLIYSAVLKRVLDDYTVTQLTISKKSCAENIKLIE